MPRARRSRVVDKQKKERRSLAVERNISSWMNFLDEAPYDIFVERNYEESMIESDKNWCYSLRKKQQEGTSSECSLCETIPASDFTLEFIRQNGIIKPLRFIDPPSKLGFRVLSASNFSVSDVLNSVGDYWIEAVDVETQGSQQMLLSEFVDYCTQKSEDRAQLLDVISVEFSQTNLEKRVKLPDFVKKLDWFELFWPKELREPSCFPMYPKMQNYCYMSVEGSYSDFHFDCGGTTAWYHVFKGCKIFWLIEPTEKNLLSYEKWALCGDENDAFFGDYAEACSRIEVMAGQTILIPSGWIHAIYTPTDSIAFGGNFLHSFSIPMQLHIPYVEDRIRVPMKYRYPFYKDMLWYVVIGVVERATGRTYLKKDSQCAYTLPTNLGEEEVETLATICNQPEGQCQTDDRWLIIPKKRGTKLHQTGGRKPRGRGRRPRFARHLQTIRDDFVCHDAYDLAKDSTNFGNEMPLLYDEEFLSDISEIELSGYEMLLDFMRKAFRVWLKPVRGLNSVVRLLDDFEKLLNYRRCKLDRKNIVEEHIRNTSVNAGKKETANIDSYKSGGVEKESSRQNDFENTTIQPSKSSEALSTNRDISLFGLEIQNSHQKQNTSLDLEPDLHDKVEQCVPNVFEKSIRSVEDQISKLTLDEAAELDHSSSNVVSRYAELDANEEEITEECACKSVLLYQFEEPVEIAGTDYSPAFILHGEEDRKPNASTNFKQNSSASECDRVATSFPTNIGSCQNGDPELIGAVGDRFEDISINRTMDSSIGNSVCISGINQDGNLCAERDIEADENSFCENAAKPVACSDMSISVPNSDVCGNLLFDPGLAHVRVDQTGTKSASREFFVHDHASENAGSGEQPAIFRCEELEVHSASGEVAESGEKQSKSVEDRAESLTHSDEDKQPTVKNSFCKGSLVIELDRMNEMQEFKQISNDAINDLCVDTPTKPNDSKNAEQVVHGNADRPGSVDVIFDERVMDEKIDYSLAKSSKGTNSNRNRNEIESPARTVDRGDSSRTNVNMKKDRDEKERRHRKRRNIVSHSDNVSDGGRGKYDINLKKSKARSQIKSARANKSKELCASDDSTRKRKRRHSEEEKRVEKFKGPSSASSNWSKKRFSSSHVESSFHLRKSSLHPPGFTQAQRKKNFLYRWGTQIARKRVDSHRFTSSNESNTLRNIFSQTTPVDSMNEVWRHNVNSDWRSTDSSITPIQHSSIIPQPSIHFNQQTSTSLMNIPCAATSFLPFESTPSPSIEPVQDYRPLASSYPSSNYLALQSASTSPDLISLPRGSLNRDNMSEEFPTFLQPNYANYFNAAIDPRNAAIEAVRNRMIQPSVDHGLLSKSVHLDPNADLRQSTMVAAGSGAEQSTINHSRLGNSIYLDGTTGLRQSTMAAAGSGAEQSIINHSRLNNPIHLDPTVGLRQTTIETAGSGTEQSAVNHNRLNNSVYRDSTIGLRQPTMGATRTVAVPSTINRCRTGSSIHLDATAGLRKPAMEAARSRIVPSPLDHDRILVDPQAQRMARIAALNRAMAPRPTVDDGSESGFRDTHRRNPSPSDLFSVVRSYFDRNCQK